MNIPALAGGVLGTGIAVGGSKIYSKANGKPAGAPGSLAHVSSNDKLTAKEKAKVLLEQTKEGAKDLLTLGGITVGVAATGSLAVGTSNKAAGIFKDWTKGAGELLDKVAVQGKSLKDIVKDTSIFKKFNSLPAPAKAGILIGAATLAVVSPIVSLVTAGKSGYIEGKHEAK